MNRRFKKPEQDKSAESCRRTSSWSGRDWIFSLLLIAILLLVYHPAWHGKPVWDDDAHLTKPALCSWDGLGRIWFELGATQQYYPVAHSAFWFQHSLWGYDFTGYHLVNIILHAFSALLLVKILRRLDIRGAWLAAAIWALHPVQVESVAWMSELKNTLSGVFYLSSALLYLRFDRERALKFYLPALGLFLLGLLTKSVIATLPAALLLLFYWKNGRLFWRKDVLPLIPFFGVGIGSGLFTAWVERTLIGADGGDFHFTLLERCLIAGRAFWFYLGKLAWPADLVFTYPRWKISLLQGWQFMFPALAIGLVSLLIWKRRQWGRGPLVAVLFFAGTLFPALGFLNIYPFRFSFVADHFQYLASIGPLVLATVGFSRFFDFRSDKVPAQVSAFSIALLGLLGFLTWRQCGMYVDKETLYTATLARNPESWMACNNLGRSLFEQGRVEEAAVQYRKALQIYPASVEAHMNFGNLLIRQHKRDEAIAEFRESLRLNPADTDASENLANALLDLGRTQEAIAQYQESLRINPAYATAHYDLGIALQQQGRTEEAAGQFREALKMNPAFQEACLSMGVALMQQGKAEEGTAEFRAALRINPAYEEAHLDLGNALLQQKQTEEAIAEFRKALQINPANAATEVKLGVVFLRLGRAEEAMVHIQKAQELQPASESIKNLAEAVRRQIKVNDGGQR